VCLAAEGALDRRAFESWLENALWDDGGGSSAADRRGDDARAGFDRRGPALEVLRAKGVLFVDDDADVELGKPETKKLVLQAVREVYEITPGPPAETGERRMNKVVLIGRGLSEAALLPGFEATVRRGGR